MIRFVAMGAVMVGLAGPAVAQTSMSQTDMVGLAHEAAANQLGVLEYCQAQGHVGPDAVAAERLAITRLPATTTNTDAAEALGKQGTIATNGTRFTLADMASRTGGTVASMCQQLGASAVQGAAMSANAGAMPAMPGGMPTMPAMPGGMPAMPGMPAAPR